MDEQPAEQTPESKVTEKPATPQAPPPPAPVPEPSGSGLKVVGIGILVLIPVAIIVAVAVFGKNQPKLPGTPGTKGTSGEQVGTAPAPAAVSDVQKKLVQQLSAAANKGNVTATWQAFNQMSREAKTPADKEYVKGAQFFVEGIFSFYKRNYLQAAQKLIEARNRKVVWSDTTLAVCCVHLCNIFWSKNNEAEALKFSKLTRQLAPNDLIALFNSGVIEWHVGRANPEKDDKKWAQSLTTFKEKAVGNTSISLDVVFIAESILNGSYDKRPPVLRPQEPAAQAGKTVDALLAAIQKARAAAAAGTPPASN